MTKKDERLFNLITKMVEEAIHRTTYPARLGKGDNDKTLWVPDRPGYAWGRIFTTDGLSAQQIRVHKINASYGAPCEVRKARDGVFEAIGSDGSEIIQYAGDSFFLMDMPTHGVTHQLFGSDPLWIDPLQFRSFLTRPTNTPGLSVYVEPYIYFDDVGVRQSWDGGTIDLTSKVPGTASHQVVIVVGLDISTGALTTVDGTSSFVATDNLVYVPFSSSDVVALTFPEYFKASAAVRMYAGQTRIDRWDIFLDVRPWFFSGSAVADGLNLQPTTISTTVTVPTGFQTIWAENVTIDTDGDLVVEGDVYILEG